MRRVLLLLSVFVSTLPIIVMTAAFYQSLEIQSEDNLRQEVQNEIDLTAKGVQDFIDERIGNMTDWANSPAVRVAFEFHRPEGLTQTLQDWIRKYPANERLSVYDVDLKEFASSKLTNVKYHPKLLRRDHAQVWIENSRIKIAIPIIDLLKYHRGFLVSELSSSSLEAFLEQISSRFERHAFKSLKLEFVNTAWRPEDNKEVFSQKILPLRSTIVNGLSLTATFESGDLQKDRSKLPWIIGFLAIVTSIATFAVLSMALTKIQQPIRALLDAMESVSQGKLSSIRLDSSFTEIRAIENHANLIVKRLGEYTQNLKSQAELKAAEELAKQVAHDIRSPVTALNMAVSTLKNLPQENRDLLSNVAKRINEIANDLLAKSHPKVSDVFATNLADTTRNLVTEKQIEFPEHKFKIQCDQEGGLANINPTELSRILSNVINNSIEAGALNISVSVTDGGAYTTISIGDDGRGISKEALSRLGEKGFSHGKTGHGLGLAHARQTLESSSGSLSVTLLEKGTLVSIVLPKRCG